MSGTALTVLALSGGVLLVAIVIAAVLGGERRRKEFTEFAAARGWTYDEDDDTLARRYELDPFGRRSSRRARHVLRGRHRGRDFTAFEYSYTTTTGNGDQTSTSTTRFTVYAVGLAGTVPTLEIRRRLIGGRLAKVFGARGVATGDAEFDADFVVRTDDESATRALLTPALTAWLGRRGDLPFTVERGDLRTWVRGQFETGQVEAMLEHLCDAADRISPATRP